MKKYILSALFTMMLLVTATITQAQSECSVTLSQPEQLTAVVSGDAEICYGGTATITVTMNGGTAPYKVFYDGNTYLAGGDPQVITFDVTLTTDAVFTGTGSTPNISATDARNCLPLFSGSATITIENIDPVITLCPVARIIEGCDTDDITGPVFSSILAVSSYAEFSDQVNQGVATDDCGIASVTYIDVAVGTCPTIITRTWTIKDAAGNSASCNQTITLDDTTYPTFTAPADITIYTDQECEYNISIAITGDVTDEYDNCSSGLQATYVDSEPAPGICEGSVIITRTWSVEDVCGNLTEHDQIITIIDNTPPTWITLSGALNANLECGDETALAEAMALIPEATDNCSDVTIEEVEPENPLNEDCIGTNGGNINAGNGSYFRFTLSGFDGLLASEIENIELQFQTNQGKGRAEFTLVSPSGQGIILVGPYCIGGNCDDGDGGWETYAPTFYPAASGFTAWNNANAIPEGAGNFTPNGALSSSNSTYITGLTGYVSKIEDLTGPMNGEWFVYARKQQSVNGSISLDYACVTPDIPEECENNEIITRSWIAKDECGNESEPFNQIIRITDIQGPVITAPENLEIVCNANVDPETAIAEWLAEATALDECQGSVEVINDFSEIDIVCGAQVTVTFTAVDACENAATPVTRTITVIDETAPVISAPENLEIICASNVDPDIQVAAWLAEATATDECDVLVTVQNDYYGIDMTCGAQVTVTFTATDACENAATPVTRTITIIDETAPVWITDPGALNANLECGDENALAEAMVLEPIATDECSDVTIEEISGNRNSVDCLGTNGGGVSLFGSYFRFSLNGFDDLTANEIEKIDLQFQTNLGKGTAEFTLVSPSGQGIILVGPYCNGGNCEDYNLFDWEVYSPTFYPQSSGYPKWNNSNSIPEGAGNFTPNGAISSINEPIITGLNEYVTSFEDFTGPMDGQWFVYSRNKDIELGFINLDYACITPRVEDDCENNQIITRSWIAKDACGNESDPFNQIIRITDTQGPVITAPENLEIVCNQANDIEETIINWLDEATAMDECQGSVEVTNDFYGIEMACSAQVTVTFTATDACENAATPVTRTITIIDETAPVISAPENLEIICASNVDPDIQVAAWLAEATATDECDALVTVQNDYYGIDMTCGAQVTVTFTAVDACENAATPVTRTITIIDETAPVITSPEPLVLTCDQSVDYSTQIATWLASATVADACDQDITVINNFEGYTQSCGTVITVTFNAMDDCENAAVPCTSTITFIDETPPVITSPEPLVLTCDQSVDYSTQIATWLASATVADDCDLDITINNDYEGYTQSCGTVITVTFNAMDDCENAAVTCTSTITFIDETAPVITAPQPLYLACDDQNAEYTVAQWLATATATDECDIDVLISNNFVSIDGYNCNNPLTVTFTAYDDCQNAAQPVTSTIYIVDDEAPVITTAQGALDMTFECSDEESLDYALSLVPQATDNCSVPGIIMISDVTTPDADCPNGYTRVRTWKFADECFNYSANYTQTITVEDNIAPVWTIIPSAMQVECNGEGNLEDINYWLNLFTGTDNCGDANVTNNFTGLSDLCGMTGTAQVIFTLSDACGNSVSETATFTIVDTQDPVFTYVPENITVECTEVPEPGTPIAMDNCSDVTVVYNGEEIETGDCAGNYTITRTWTATDDCGNSNTCTQIITVEDTTAPEFTVFPENLVVECNGEGNLEDLNGWLNSSEAIDNCSNVTITNNYSGIIYECGNTGTAVVTFTATDDCGNSATYEAGFTIIDTSLPWLTVPANVVVDNDEGLCGAQVDLIATADDECGSVTITNNITGTNNASGFYEVGTTTILWTATDECGNSITGQTIVTVNDTEAPSITCPQDITVNADPESCDAFVTVPWPQFADNCNINGIVNSYTGTANASTTYPIGTTEITWTVTDDYGNTAECTMTVTVVDEIDPVITCPEDVIVNNDPGLCGAEISIPQPEASDNCGVASIVNDFNGTANASGFYPVGTTTITWTVTDNYGNTAECTMTVTVNDNENPVIACPEDITVSTDSDICGAQVTVPAPEVDDNCGVQTIVNDFTGTANASGEYPIGTTIVTWTVTDLNGNTATCEMTVTVNDDVNPTIICPEDVTANNDPGACSAMIEIPAPEANDNCGIESIVNDFNGTANASGEYPVGTTTIIWTVTDIHGNTAECEMTVTVTDTEAPVIVCPESIVDVVASENCEAYVEIPQPEVSDNCGIESVINDFNSTANASGYYPAGTTTITWTVTDVNGFTSTCTMTVTVIAPPVAVDDFATTDIDTPVTIDVLANDTDCDDNIDPTTVINITDPSNGAVMVVDGAFIYTPNSGYTGTDTFNYRVCDENELCDEATVTITISGEIPVDLYLVANPDSDTTEVNTPKVIVNLENDIYNFEGVVPVVTLLEAPVHGSAIVNSDNTVTYNPYADYTGTDVYTYILSDLNGVAVSDTTTSTIVIVPAPQRDTLIIYNIITPDGDNANDFWFIEGITEYPDNEVLVFNRWGDQIRYFERYNNTTVRWDGTNRNGELLPAATYYYIVKLRSIEKIYTGWVVIHSHEKK